MRFRSRFAAVLVLAALPVFAQSTLNNDSVIKLSKSGLSDDLIVQTITSQPGTYATDAGDLVTLKQAGVSERVISAMMTKGSGGASAATPSAGNSTSYTEGVDEIGVYYKDHSGKWVQMSPEIVNFKSGGVLKSIASNGIVKGDQNGHLQGESAPLAVARPTDFLIYAPEGTAPNEYQLLKLRISKNTREFRSSTGGVFHSSSGANRDTVAFNPTKVASRKYLFTLDSAVAPGEYGILPPGAVSTSNAASGGKIYTFHVIE